jgi:hypothetical protein
LLEEAYKEDAAEPVAYITFLLYTDIVDLILVYLTMLFTDSVFVGIDTTGGRKAFTYAALDLDLNLIALDDAELDDVSAFLGGQKSVTVAVNAPSHVNIGLVRKISKNKA